MHFLYLASIIISIFGLSVIDKKFSLALYKNRQVTLKAILFVVLTLLIADVIGVSIGIFFSGESKFMSGIYLIPDIPLEEIFFLILLAYCPLIIYSAMEKFNV